MMVDSVSVLVFSFVESLQDGHVHWKVCEHVHSKQRDLFVCWLLNVPATC